MGKITYSPLTDGRSSPRSGQSRRSEAVVQRSKRAGAERSVRQRRRHDVRAKDGLEHSLDETRDENKQHCTNGCNNNTAEQTPT